jgi:hypothetical protein
LQRSPRPAGRSGVKELDRITKINNLARERVEARERLGQRLAIVEALLQEAVNLRERGLGEPTGESSERDAPNGAVVEVAPIEGVARLDDAAKRPVLEGGVSTPIARIGNLRAARTHLSASKSSFGRSAMPASKFRSRAPRGRRGPGPSAVCERRQVIVLLTPHHSGGVNDIGDDAGERDEQATQIRLCGGRRWVVWARLSSDR